MKNSTDETDVPAEEFVYTPELATRVADMIQKHSSLEPLTDNGIIVLCCTRVRLDKNGDPKPFKGKPIKIKKIGDMERLFLEEHAHYVLCADGGFWDKAPKNEQDARLYDALMSIEVEINDKGKVKLKKRESDVPFSYIETVATYGAFDALTINMRDCMLETKVGIRLTEMTTVNGSGRKPAPATDDDVTPEPEPELESDEDDVPRIQAAAHVKTAAPRAPVVRK